MKRRGFLASVAGLLGLGAVAKAQEPEYVAIREMHTKLGSWRSIAGGPWEPMGPVVAVKSYPMQWFDEHYGPLDR